MNPIRRKRLEKRILVLVSDLLYREFKDPSIGFVTFTKVDLAGDTSTAKIFVSVYEEPDRQAETMDALRKTRGFVKAMIAKNIKIKNIPNVEYILDDSLARAENLDKLIDT